MKEEPTPHYDAALNLRLADAPKRRGRPPKAEQWTPEDEIATRKTVDTYFAQCKPLNPAGYHPTVMGLWLVMGELPRYGKARLEAYLEHLLAEGNPEAIHSLRKHFGW